MRKQKDENVPAEILDLLCYEAIVESESQAMTLYREEMYTKNSPTKGKEDLIVAVYDPKLRSRNSIGLKMHRRSRKIYLP